MQSVDVSDDPILTTLLTTRTLTECSYSRARSAKVAGHKPSLIGKRPKNNTNASYHKAILPCSMPTAPSDPSPMEPKWANEASGAPVHDPRLRCSG